MSLRSPTGSIHDAEMSGVKIEGENTRGRLEDCDISWSESDGVRISHGADPLLLACKYVFLGMFLFR